VPHRDLLDRLGGRLVYLPADQELAEGDAGGEGSPSSTSSMKAFCQLGRQAPVVSDEKLPQSLKRGPVWALVQPKRGQGAAQCLVIASAGDQLLEAAVSLPTLVKVRVESGPPYGDL
jgi:hypothetical protein